MESVLLHVSPLTEQLYVSAKAALKYPDVYKRQDRAGKRSKRPRKTIVYKERRGGYAPSVNYIFCKLAGKAE